MRNLPRRAGPLFGKTDANASSSWPAADRVHLMNRRKKRIRHYEFWHGMRAKNAAGTGSVGDRHARMSQRGRTTGDNVRLKEARTPKMSESVVRTVAIGTAGDSLHLRLSLLIKSSDCGRSPHSDAIAGTGALALNPATPDRVDWTGTSCVGATLGCCGAGCGCCAGGWV